MEILKWLIGGVIVVAIAVAARTTIDYVFPFDVGVVATRVNFEKAETYSYNADMASFVTYGISLAVSIGIAVIVGAGVRKVAKDLTGVAPAIFAVCLAVFSILLAKYAGSYLLTSNFMDDQIARSRSANFAIAACCNEIIEKMPRSQQENLKWPYVSLDTPLRKRFPPGIWDDAERIWNQLTPKEQEAKLAVAQADAIANRHKIEASMHQAIFMGAFGFGDLFWFGLTIVIAFQIGYSFDNAVQTTDEQESDLLELEPLDDNVLDSDYVSPSDQRPKENCEDRQS